MAIFTDHAEESKGKNHRHRQPQQNIDLLVYCEETESELEWSGLKIHVKQIPKTVDSKKLKTLFNKLGPVTNCKVIETSKTQLYSYGFVTFAQKDTVQRALQSNLTIDGASLICEALSPQKAHENLQMLIKGHENDTYLFLPNIPKDTNKVELVKYFRGFGPLRHMKLSIKDDKETNSLYVQYENISSVSLVKSKRHSLLNISATQPKLTLVSKIRVFNTGKYRKLLAAAEELLHTVPINSLLSTVPQKSCPYSLFKSRQGSSVLLKAKTNGLCPASQISSAPTQPSLSFGLNSSITSSDSEHDPFQRQWPKTSFGHLTTEETNYRINIPLHSHTKKQSRAFVSRQPPTQSFDNQYTPFKSVFLRH